MKSLAPPSLLVLAFLILFSGTQPAAAGPALGQDEPQATVVTASGWRLTPVTVRWVDAEAGLLVTRTDGASRMYPPEDLQAVYDQGGRNISASVLPGWAVRRLAGGSVPAASGGGWGQPSAPPATAAPVQIRWQRMLSLGAEWNKPHGDDFLDSDGGEAADIRGRVLVCGGIYLTGGFSWQYLSAPAVGDFAKEGDFDKGRLRGFWAGLALVSGSGAGMDPWFYLEGGLGRFQADLMPVASDDDGYLGYKAGLGLMKPFGAHSALDIGLRATHVVNLELQQGDDSHTLMGVHVALVLHN